MYVIAVKQPTKMLRNLASWLDQAAAYAEERSFSPENLVQARLAPDQFTLVRQVQSACDTAKFLASRLCEIEAPSFPDEEKTFDEVKKRIADTLAFLDGVEESALGDFADRELKLSFLPEGSWVRADDYMEQFAIPNFYFHVSMAYAILRHNGVPLGKRDYLGSLPIQGIGEAS